MGRAMLRQMKILLLSGLEGHAVPFETAWPAGSPPPHPHKGDSLGGRSQHRGINQQGHAKQRLIFPSQTNAIMAQEPRQ